jgi:hypothetical protein
MQASGEHVDIARGHGVEGEGGSVVVEVMVKHEEEGGGRSLVNSMGVPTCSTSTRVTVLVLILL